MYALAVKANFPEKGETIVEQHLAEISDFPISENYLVVIGSPVYQKPTTKNVASNWDHLLKQYNWNINEARTIIFCESSGNPQAHNLNHRTKDNSHGLFQINTYGSLANTRPTREWLIIPANNISYAYSIWQKEGWRPWRNCARRHGLI